MAWTPPGLCCDDTILPEKVLHAISFVPVVIDFSRFYAALRCAKVESITINPAKAQWFTDTVTQNLRLFVGVSGKKVWYVRYLDDGKERTHKLGPAGDAVSGVHTEYEIKKPSE